MPLLKRLLTNTLYLGSAQKTILISKAAVVLLSTFIFRTLMVLQKIQESEGHTVIGCLLIAIALVLVLVDREPEPPVKTMQEYQSTISRPFSIPVFLLITLASIAIWWAGHQTSFINMDYSGRINEPNLVTPFASMAISMGIIVLLIYALDVKNPFVYMGVGVGIMALLICIFLTMEIKPDNQWFFVILNSVGISLAQLGVILWICRYTDFPFLTFLLSMIILTEEISYLLISFGIDLRMLFKIQFTYMNF
jgi:hypothetical protein